MDVSAISTPVKTAAAGANPAATVDSTDPASAFSALLNLVGSKFTTNFTLGNLEMKLMRTPEPVAQPAADTQDNRDQNADRTVDQSASKTNSDKTKDTKNDASNKDNTNASNQTTSTDATAQQNQAAVQAAVAVAVQVPVVAQVQAAPTAKVDGTAVAAAATTPVEQVQEPTTIAPQIAAQAAATVAATAAAPVVKAAAAPVAKTADAPVVDQAAAPIIVQAKAAAAAPTVAPVTQTAAPVQQATDAVSDDANLHAMAADAGPKVAAPQTQQTQGPAVVRSAAAAQQAQNLSASLGGDAKLQVQVQVNGPAATAASQQTEIDPSPYNHYVGYSGASDTSTANGQVGITDATNALVQNSSQVQKTPAESVQALAAFPPAPVAPQPQSPPTQQGASTAAALDAPAQVSATQSSGGQSAAQNNGYAFDSFSPNTGSAAATNATKTTQAPAERPQVTPQQVIDQIKVNITRATKAGADKVTIQLKPVELGRIDVKLEMSEDQKVRVTVTADNKDTLAMLQGDHKTLERALNDAGLRTDTNNLQFNLRSEADPQAAQQNGGNSRGTQGGGNGSQSADVASADADFAGFDYAAAAQARGGVDTFA